ncbi:hypothetical protein Cgig2_001655 [Carnegiea gigantea]|uniref:Uncharacterized protein n=1 Tax=Carnegiea gigantea TaxID=171969 RepID=A0A9Q1Q5P7_9CARY|nr:hypothetical protein Cgig2_001655 [Carnegiea gigantea]
MVSPSRGTSTTQTSGGSGSSRSDFDNSAKYYCNYGYEAVMHEMDDNYRRRCLVCPLERMCGHDIWLKRSRTRHDKAIIIRRLQVSVNKLKATLLEKGHAVRVSEETNTKLAVAVSCAQRRMSAKHLSRTVRISLWLKHIARPVSTRRSMKIITNMLQSWPLQNHYHCRNVIVSLNQRQRIPYL